MDANFSFAFYKTLYLNVCVLEHEEQLLIITNHFIYFINECCFLDF